jgi:hypothetical protein
MPAHLIKKVVAPGTPNACAEKNRVCERTSSGNSDTRYARGDGLVEGKNATIAMILFERGESNPVFRFERGKGVWLHHFRLSDVLGPGRTGKVRLDLKEGKRT